ncbi:thiamine diphosphokinase [Helicobacter sp. faydin-H20]|uniref:thiamine diphosphokinase n=1 Tax=Helicobacter anatolicus TaxID=2905874 RepID=UPI001E594E61|nr:thiamine diphosphokinase [Helicobacter anatolicus]MCE3036732.1 thiamine diphosphokinase [Helicobacter anatolicus]
MKKQALILANGQFPRNPTLIQAIKNATFLVACDGAIKHLDRLKIIPNIIIGDLDSISKKFQKKYANKIIHIKEQESNDLSKAFFYCIKQNFTHITILGATGKREDHTLANISLLLQYYDYANVEIKSDYGYFKVYETPCKVPSHKGQQISLFCLETHRKITSTNLKYPLKNLALPLWANGTLNEALDSHFSLISDKKTKIIIYQTLI